MQKDFTLWQFIEKQLSEKKPVIFLCVLESSGSSPGRKGFKMAVSKDEMQGSIGGGIMEHKFVTYAKELLLDDEVETIVKKQVHSKKESDNQSGMICSGEQTIAIYKVKSSDQNAIHEIIQSIENQNECYFIFSSEAIQFYKNIPANLTTSFQKLSDNNWLFTEAIKYENHLYIIGGGHVALALSKLMQQLNFHITVFDDRDKLNTFEQNNYAHQKNIIDYKNIAELIPEDENQYVVIMTFGYRSDGIVLRQLINKKYKYLGLLGSKTKVAKMLNELIEEGFDQNKINSIHAPVGLSINSQTPDEIAVSIAAEIIHEKNKDLKTE